MRVQIFIGTLGTGEMSLAHRALAHCLQCLFAMAVDYLNAHPEVPDLYVSGVRYQEQTPYVQEDWYDIPTALKYGAGDCKVLACWRAAELVVRHGVDAYPDFVWLTEPDDAEKTLFHVQVKLPDGTVEDPSVRLGMGEAA